MPKPHFSQQEAEELVWQGILSEKVVTVAELQQQFFDDMDTEEIMEMASDLQSKNDADDGVEPEDDDD
jgi:hypothetical protein